MNKYVNKKVIIILDFFIEMYEYVKKLGWQKNSEWVSKGVNVLDWLYSESLRNVSHDLDKLFFPPFF